MKVFFHNRRSRLISLPGLLLIFILLLIFSGIAVHPIVESYEKQKRFITDASHEIKSPPELPMHIPFSSY